VPAIDHDGVIVHECAAVALYLADAFPKAGLAPGIGDPRRGPYVTWLAYWAGPMNSIVTARFRGWDKDGASTGFGTFEDMENFLARTLDAHSYVAGDKFSAADILVGGAMEFFTQGGVLAKRKVFEDYLQRLSERPAKARALAKDNG
jgi:glutathione S-transferase